MISAEIKDIQIDQNGNIAVITEYKDGDGNLLQTGMTRYSFSAAVAVEDVIAKAKAEIDAHCKALVVRTYAKTKNTDSIEDIKSGLLGYTSEVTQVNVNIDGKSVDIEVDGLVAIDGEIVSDKVKK